MNRVLDQEDKILHIAVATRYPFMIKYMPSGCFLISNSPKF